jgi:hypothetical protein
MRFFHFSKTGMARKTAPMVAATALAREGGGRRDDEYKKGHLKQHRMPLFMHG